MSAAVVKVFSEAGTITCIDVPEGVIVEVHDVLSGERLDLEEGHTEQVQEKLDAL